MPSQLMGEIEAEEDKEPAKKFRGKISYEWRPFTNPSRNDDLQLSHWVKCYTSVANDTKTIPAEQDGYPFAKYNKRPNVLRYDEEEWKSLVKPDAEWTKAETDYLLDLIETLEMRWFAVADRYEFMDDAGNKKDRSVEDIKGRYYDVARQLMIGREGGTTGIANHVLIKHPFDAPHERRRKAGLEEYLKRSPEEEEQEDIILAQAAKIEAKRKAEEGKDGLKGTVGAPSAAARQELIEISEFTNDVPVGTLPLLDEQVHPVEPADGSRVVVRSLHLRNLADAKVDGLAEKQRELMLRLLEGLKFNEPPKTCSRAIYEAYITLVKEGIEYIELRKQVEAKQLMKKRMRPSDGVELENLTSLKTHQFEL
jgi:DNA methyltransferase 1-associated protein 1